MFVDIFELSLKKTSDELFHTGIFMLLSFLCTISVLDAFYSEQLKIALNFCPFLRIVLCLFLFCLPHYGSVVKAEINMLRRCTMLFPSH